MEDTSIFQDKAVRPTDQDLQQKLGNTYVLWKELDDFVMQQYPDAQTEWSYPGKKYGWSYRIKDKKRVILYLLPRDGFFKAALVFGPKAYEAVMTGDVSAEIKKELEQATPYREGRGIRITMENETKTGDIKKLVEIKIKH